jgi:hypothetical protein
MYYNIYLEILDFTSVVMYNRTWSRFGLESVVVISSLGNVFVTDNIKQWCNYNVQDKSYHIGSCSFLGILISKHQM